MTLTVSTGKVRDTQLNEVFPYLSRLSHRNLGFIG